MSVTGMFIWLGGGQPTETADGYERTGYAVTGAGVTLFAVVAAGVTAVALRAAEWPAAAVVPTALVTGLLAGLLGRALAGAESTARPDLPAGKVNTRAVAARLGVAVLAGLVVAELATTVLFDGTVDRMLDERAAAAAATAPAVRTAQDELDRAAADRAALDRAIAAAATDMNSALIVARCEFNPTPECPQTKITGVPGRGPEAQTANQLLEDARAGLTAAQERVAPLDQRVADARAALGTARSTATAAGDRGFGARWSAVHDHTLAQPGAFVLRLLTWAVFALLALLPLILRWWRGETTQERRRAAAAVRDRAELAADTAIAQKEAEIRVDTAAVQAEQQLTAVRLAAEADTTIDRERQRTRVIAALGGIEIEVTGPAGTDALPAGPGPAGTSALPVPLDENRPARPAAGSELPVLGTLPFTDTAARLIRPLVPGFVTAAIDNALDTASRPLRTARHVLTEAEEITFTLRRARKVTVAGRAGDPRPVSGGSPGESTAGAAELTLDADAIVSATTRLEPVEPATPTGPGAAELPAGHSPRELPPGK